MQGRPVLVGTTSVETSELVADKLQKEGILHEVRLCVLRPLGLVHQIFALAAYDCHVLVHAHNAGAVRALSTIQTAHAP